MNASQAHHEISLIEVLDRVLDKGIVIQHQVDIAIGGLYLFRIEGIIVLTSFETALSATESSDAPISAAEEYVRGLGRLS
jgi:Gas vesicle protein